MFNWRQLEESHQERDPRIERFIKRAATMLSYGCTEEECVTALTAEGAQEHEAINAIRAGVILNEMPNL